jgi:uncharacterized membrane protein
VLIFLVIVWLSTAPMSGGERGDAAQGATARFAEAQGFEAVEEIMLSRCSMCHAAEPVWAGLHWPPKGVMLETEEQIARHARAIYLQSGLSHAMPPANITYTSDAERAQIIAWYRDAISR